jgi:hypothetical protein
MPVRYSKCRDNAIKASAENNQTRRREWDAVVLSTQHVAPGLDCTKQQFYRYSVTNNDAYAVWWIGTRDPVSRMTGLAYGIPPAESCQVEFEYGLLSGTNTATVWVLFVADATANTVGLKAIAILNAKTPYP